MIRGSTTRSSTGKYGMVPGGLGVGRKPLPPPISINKQPMMGAFMPGANQGSRMMGWDGVKNTQPSRDVESVRASGVTPSQLINPLGKVGGANASTTQKTKPKSKPRQPIVSQPIQPIINNQNPPKPISRPSNNNNSNTQTSSARINPPVSKPTANIKVATQVSSQPTIDPRIVDDVKELKSAVSVLQNHIEQLNEKIEQIQWDSYTFVADVARVEGIRPWNELPHDTNDFHVSETRVSYCQDKTFDHGTTIRLSFPLVEFNVTMEDQSVQVWRFARTRIFREDGWKLSDVFFPLEISYAFVSQDEVTPESDFNLVTTVSNVRP